MQPCQLRPATVADADVIAHHRVAMFKEMGEIDDAEDISSLLAASRQRLIEQLTSGEYVGWVAVHDGTVVAGAGVLLHQYLPSPQNLRGRPTAYVLNVFTEPPHRRRGLASELLQRVFAWCTERDIPRISLHASTAATPLYERAGFAVSNEMRANVRQAH
jgi:GNAT superfamily N-acetyltransferase